MTDIMKRAERIASELDDFNSVIDRKASTVIRELVLPLCRCKKASEST